jgi:flagellar biosynthesis protein FliQ
MSSIPFADYARLERALRRTTLIRTGLAVALVALVVASAAAATQPSAKTLSFLPRGSSGLVVLDLSASISTDTFQRIGATLNDLAATNGRYGLVIFSDVAYQALPPGTPSAALKPYARYFMLPPAQSGFLPQFPVNPWTNAFSGGTRIGAGLALAFRIIQTKKLARPAVILVSDLDDDPGDLKTLAGVSLAYRQAGIPVRIVALDPQPKDEALFGHLLERAATVQQARLPQERAQTVGADTPPWLTALAVLAALALAANELWGARLAWGQA